MAKKRMGIQELDEMAAQLTDEQPYYLPRLIAEYQSLLAVWSEIARAAEVARCSAPEWCDYNREPKSECVRCRVMRLAEAI